MDTLTKNALVFAVQVYVEQLEAGECGDAVYLTMAKGIIDQGIKAGMIIETESTYFVKG